MIIEWGWYIHIMRRGDKEKSWLGSQIYFGGVGDFTYRWEWRENPYPFSVHFSSFELISVYNVVDEKSDTTLVSHGRWLRSLSCMELIPDSLQKISKRFEIESIQFSKMDAFS